MADLPVDSSVVNSEVWSPEAINANPWPEVVVGILLLAYIILVFIARRRDEADIVETKLKEKKWEQQLRVNAKAADDRSFTKLLKKRFQSLHLWLSIGYRPHGDSFTSVERVTCLLTFCYVDMAFCAVGFGSDFASPMNNFWLIMIISTIAAVVAVQLIHVPFFQRAGAESAREAWLEHQRQEAQRGRGLSIPVDQPPKPADSGCSCEGCYGHCCGKRYPDGCKVVGFVACAVTGLLAVFITLNWGTKFVLHKSGDETFGDMNRYGMWIICVLISWVFDLIFLRPLIAFGVASFMYLTQPAQGSTPIPTGNGSLLPDAHTAVELNSAL